MGILESRVKGIVYSRTLKSVCVMTSWCATVSSTSSKRKGSGRRGMSRRWMRSTVRNWRNWEEALEFSENPSPEEMADVFEVINATAKRTKWTLEDTGGPFRKKKKQEEQGGFERRLIL